MNGVPCKPEILVVDDNPNNLYSFRMILENPGMEVITASSGQEALRLLLRQKDILLILLDVQMPEMDGFETAELIRGREEFRNIPILFITAVHLSDEFASRGFRVGGYDYITKPVNNDVLKSKVNVFLALERQRMQLMQEIAERNNREIAQRRQVELDLAQKATELARFKAELEQFAYAASHDLQEPIRAVNNYMQLLELHHSGKMDAKTEAYIGNSLDALKRMRTLIDDLLDYSRVTTRGRPFEVVKGESILQEALNNVRTAIEESQASITHDRLPSFMADATQMVSLFQDLIYNAIRFRSEAPPRIHISARCLPEPQSGSSMEDQNGAQSGCKQGHWLFSVRDNGIGMEQEGVERIFQVFQRLHTRTEYPGTGIGLAICKRIVERHGGQIWVESQPGMGSTFFFTVPKKECHVQC